MNDPNLTSQVSHKANNDAPPIQRTTYAPTIDMPGAGNGEIVFNSRSPHSTEATPTFYTEGGEPVIGETVRLNPNEIRFVSIKSLIPKKYRGRHDWGGMSVAYTGDSMAIAPQIILRETVQSSSFDVSFSELNGKGSDTQEAVWWMPKKGKVIIALGNSSDESAQTTLQFSDGETQIVDIAPFATRYVERNNKQSGGASVKLITTGAAGNLKAAGFVSSSDNKFTSGVRFYDTKSVVQPNLFATDFKPKGSTAYLLLKNTTTNTITAQPRFLPVSGEDGAFELPAVKISPNGIVEVDLKPLTKAVKTRADLETVSVQITNRGGTGSLIGALYATENASGMTHDIPLRDSGTVSHSTGGYPVRLDGDYQTTLSITNVSGKASKFTMQIYYKGGIYALQPQEVAAGATARFDIRKLRDERIPDSTGGKLPQDLTVAQIRWSLNGGASNQLIGRAEMVSVANKVVSSYSCGLCCPYDFFDGRITPNIAYVYPGDTFQFAAMQRDTDCYGNIMPAYSVNANWTSGDYNISDVFNGLATAVGIGDAQLTAAWTGSSWMDDGSDNCIETMFEVAPTGDLIVQSPSINSITPTKGSVGGKILVSVDGSGLTSGTIVNPIPGITFSNYNYYGGSGSQFDVVFNISGNATPGNNAVSVSKAGASSNSVDFYVQIPKTAAREELQTLVVIEPGPGDILNAFGEVVEPNGSDRCGAYRNVKYKLVDQNGEPLNLGLVDPNIGLSVTEILSNFQSPSGFPQPAAKTLTTLAEGIFGDILAVSGPYPICPTPFAFSETQKFKVVIDSVEFILTTQNTIEISRSATGQWIINSINVVI